MFTPSEVKLLAELLEQERREASEAGSDDAARRITRLLAKIKSPQAVTPTWRP